MIEPFSAKQVGWTICNFICRVEGQVLEESPVVLSAYNIKEHIIQKYTMRRWSPRAHHHLPIHVASFLLTRNGVDEGHSKLHCKPPALHQEVYH